MLLLSTPKCREFDTLCDASYTGSVRFTLLDVCGGIYLQGDIMLYYVYSVIETINLMPGNSG